MCVLVHALKCGTLEESIELLKYTIKLSRGSVSYDDDDLESEVSTPSGPTRKLKGAREELIELQKKQVSSFEEIASVVENILGKGSNCIPSSKTNELFFQLCDLEMGRSNLFSDHISLQN